MALSRKEALDVTGRLDAVAETIQTKCAAFGIPEQIANDFARRSDVISGLVEQAARIRRDKQGNLLKGADFPADDIGRETGGTLVGDPDEAYMDPNFSQQENRELRELQESGQMSGVNAPARRPTPGKQADLDASLKKLSKMAHESEVHVLGDLVTSLKICSAKLSGSGVGNLASLVAGINKVSITLDKIQDRLISATGKQDEFVLLVQDEAGKAVNAVQEVEPYLMELSNSIQGVKAGSSPTAQLIAEETVEETSGKLGRLVQLASTIVSKCDKKIGELLKVGDED